MNIISGTKLRFNFNSPNKFLKCIALADAVGYSLIIILPLVFPLSFSIFFLYMSLGISSN